MIDDKEGWIDNQEYKNMTSGFDKSHPYSSSTSTAPTMAQAVIKTEEQYLAQFGAPTKHEIEIKQTEALTTLAKGIGEISTFLTGGGLQAIINAQTKGSIMQSILGGLASHDGRKALDAQTIKQNSLEIVEMIESVFNKMHERLQDKNRDPEIKEPKESP